MVRLAAKLPNDASAHIKKVARRLFAEKGVDGVTVREIATAAGQKNHGAVGYYFGSKENLVRELVVDGAAMIDARRNAMLDALEAESRPLTIADMADVMIYPSVNLADQEAYGEDSYTRFIVMLGMTHGDMFMDALENRWNSGYQRCLDHLRRLTPHLDDRTRNQRFAFLGAYLGGVLAMRERVLAGPQPRRKDWASPHVLSHFASTVTALLAAP